MVCESSKWSDLAWRSEPDWSRMLFNTYCSTGNYMYHLRWHSSTLYSAVAMFLIMVALNGVISLNYISWLVFVINMYCVLYEVGTEFSELLVSLGKMTPLLAYIYVELSYFLNMLKKLRVLWTAICSTPSQYNPTSGFVRTSHERINLKSVDGGSSLPNLKQMWHTSIRK